jgi:predicted ATPase
LLAVMYRSAESGTGLAAGGTAERLLRRGVTTLLPLEPLGVHDVATLVGQLSGKPASAELARRVAAETDGNPFFVEEVVKHIAEHDRLALPESLRLALGQRLHRLSARCRQLLATAALIGRDAEYRLLATAGSLAPDDLDEALATRVLEPAPGEERLVFQHALVRQAVLAELTDARRRRRPGPCRRTVVNTDAPVPRKGRCGSVHRTRTGCG